jgi:hypothetical protein
LQVKYFKRMAGNEREMNKKGRKRKKTKKERRNMNI